ERFGVPDEDAEDAPSARELADRGVGRGVDPGGEEALELRAGGADDAQRRVAGPGQLRSGLNEPLQHGVKRQFRGDRHAGLDERAEALLARAHGGHAFSLSRWPAGTRSPRAVRSIAGQGLTAPPVSDTGSWQAENASSC